MQNESVMRQSVNVNLENGLHLVPCSRIAQRAARFSCAIQIHKESRTVDAKSVLDLMTLNAEHGTTLILEARGDGAADAILQLVQLFESNFEVDEVEN